MRILPKTVNYSNFSGPIFITFFDLFGCGLLKMRTVRFFFNRKHIFLQKTKPNTASKHLCTTISAPPTSLTWSSCLLLTILPLQRGFYFTERSCLVMCCLA